MNDNWDDQTDQDELTPILCLACEGQYRILHDTLDGRYIMARCRWCTQGAMNQTQFIEWTKYCQEKI